MEASAHLLEVSPRGYIPFAVALEMIHAFTLIHDDLPCMDDDDMRRGKPTNHKVYGEGLALLAGDALMPLAFEVCLEAAPQFLQDRWSSALHRLIALSGARGVIGGQAAEMTLTGKSSLQELRHMHALKTGALFEAAILIPGDLAGIQQDAAKYSALANFAREFGLAFQAADDLDDAASEFDAATGTYPATSILHHLPATEVRAHTLHSLNECRNSLRKLWPLRCDPLLAVIGQLETATRSE